MARDLATMGGEVRKSALAPGVKVTGTDGRPMSDEVGEQGDETDGGARVVVLDCVSGWRALMTPRGWSTSLLRPVDRSSTVNARSMRRLGPAIPSAGPEKSVLGKQTPWLLEPRATPMSAIGSRDEGPPDSSVCQVTAFM